MKKVLVSSLSLEQINRFIDKIKQEKKSAITVNFKKSGPQRFTLKELEDEKTNQESPQNAIRKEKASKLFEGLEEHMSYLYYRWQDEKEYEDINDYSVKIKPEIEAIGGQFLKMTKKPFGFQYKLDDAIYSVTMSATAYQYNRIA